MTEQQEIKLKTEFITELKRYVDDDGNIKHWKIPTIADCLVKNIKYDALLAPVLPKWDFDDCKHYPCMHQEIVWKDFGSKGVIGFAKERFKQLKHKEWDWRSFYNGWLEGRVDMLAEIKGWKSNYR